MSKNTRNTAFRKVDVDQFEEEKYEEEIAPDEGVTGPSDTEVQAMISKYPLTWLYQAREFIITLT